MKLQCKKVASEAIGKKFCRLHHCRIGTSAPHRLRKCPAPAARRILVRAQRRPESSLPFAPARQFSQSTANSHFTGRYRLLRPSEAFFELIEHLQRLHTMAETAVTRQPSAISRPVSEALLNEKVQARIASNATPNAAAIVSRC